MEEDDLFWAVGASEADDEATPPFPLAPTAPVPFAPGTYWCVARLPRLREHHGVRCRVYAVEERSVGSSQRVPVRYGIRFLGDDAYWVVPANEVDVALRSQ